jgi:hypothetical protein
VRQEFLERACSLDSVRPVRTCSTQQQLEIFYDLSNSGPAVRLCSEGRATARPEEAAERPPWVSWAVSMETNILARVGQVILAVSATSATALVLQLAMVAA